MLRNLFWLESANCNFTVGAWASAAGDYTKAAELVLQLQEEGADEPDCLQRDASEYYKKAAAAWTQMGEKSKSAEAQVQAVIA